MGQTNCKIYFIYIFLVVLLLTNGCETGGDRFTPAKVELPKQGLILPFTLEKELPFLEVMINDRGPYKLLLDTGAAVLTLTEKVADELGLPESHRLVKTIVITPTGKKIIPLSIVTVNKLRLGDATFRRLDAEVVDSGEFRQAGLDFDGILGFQVFRECLLTIDFPREHLILERGKLQRRNDFPTDPNSYAIKLQTIPARISRGVSKIPVIIGFDTPKPRIVKLIVDTGYNGCIALPLKAKAYGIPSNPAGETNVATKAEVFSTSLFQLKTEVVVGDSIIKNPIVSYRGNEGSIGNALLKSFVITFDQKQQLVRIVRKN